VNDPQDGLSIGELARQTGVPAATLRSWEDRYGFRARGGSRGDTAATDAAIPRLSGRSCGCGRPA
jgi:transposase-like protein